MALRTICFTETMRGRLDARDIFAAADSSIELRGLRVEIDNSHTPRGAAGLLGTIGGGEVFAPSLSAQPMTVTGGHIEILRSVAPRACEMRYEMRCIARAPGATAFSIMGRKNVAARRGGVFALWRETTTLIIELSAADEPAAPRFPGAVHVLPRDFVRQLFSLRSGRTSSLPAALANVAAFLRFFVARIAPVYLPALTRPLARDD